MKDSDREKLARRSLLGASKKAFSGKETFPSRFFRQEGEKAAQRQTKYRNYLPLRTPGDRGINL
jgi:hypothetical protein